MHAHDGGRCNTPRQTTDNFSYVTFLQHINDFTQPIEIARPASVSLAISNFYTELRALHTWGTTKKETAC